MIGCTQRGYVSDCLPIGGRGNELDRRADSEVVVLIQKIADIPEPVASPSAS